VVSDMSQQREHDIGVLITKHEQQLAELISKHEQELQRAGQEMLMRSELVQRRGPDADDVMNTLDTSQSVVAASSTDSVYMKMKPSPRWVLDHTHSTHMLGIINA